jgi:hypothetical protein
MRHATLRVVSRYRLRPCTLAFARMNQAHKEFRRCCAYNLSHHFSAVIALSDNGVGADRSRQRRRAPGPFVRRGALDARVRKHYNLSRGACAERASRDDTA